MVERSQSRTVSLPLSGGWEASSRVRLRPGQLVALLLLVFGAAWLAHLSYTSLSPPTDNIEQLTWVGSIEGGYYKHPPLPTWLFWLPVQLFGATAWTSYAVGATCTLGAMALMWRLLSRMRGWHYATLALLAALCITYYNGRLYYYNHNVVLMALITISAVCCWKARITGSAVWWAALGLATGLGGLAKYQIVVTAACVLVFWLHQRGWRDPAQRRGLLLATLVALAVFSPHIDWLRSHDFAPINYAIESSLGAHLEPHARLLKSAHWLADQVLNRAMPAWVLLGAASVLSRHRIAPLAGLPTEAAPAHKEAGRALLLSWGLVPLLFMPLVGLLAGADLQLQWGTPFLLFAVPAAMELASRWIQWGGVPLRPAFMVFVAMQIFLLVLSHITSPRGVALIQDHHWRAFDGAALARLLERPARAALGGKIEVISGPGAAAGALALELADRPRVLINGRVDQSPWIKSDPLGRCSILELGSPGSLTNSLPVGEAFPGLVWRVIKPDRNMTTCPS